ncbi:MAG: AI-2E family transporter [Vicinamibacteria bacterium]|nr:AI-2E family transporter [Vicinamibacteria bacterium]
MPDGSIDRFGPGSRVLLVAAAVVVLAAGLRAAAVAVVPVLLGVFLAVIGSPLLDRLRRLPLPGGRRLPHGLAVLLTIVAGSTVFVILALVLTTSFRDLAEAAPRYEQRFVAMAGEGRAWLARHGMPADAPLPEMLGPQQLLGLFSGTAATVTRLLTQFVLVVLVLAFALMEGPRLPAKLHAAFGESFRAEERLAKVAAEVQVYLRVKALVSLATGVGCGLWVAALGVDFAFLWGFLAFVLNFIPNLGSILAAAPPTLLALVQHGPGSAIAVVIGIVVVNQVMSSVVEPHLMGRSLGLSPLVVILSLVAWGFILGGVGIVLAVPVTMTLKILLENSEDLRWLAVLMGGGAREPSPPR